MIIRKLFLCIFIILIALTSNAFGRDGVHGGKWWHDSSLSKKLSLNEKEIQKIDDLFVESTRRIIDLRSSIMKDRFELRNLLESRTGNEAAVIEQFNTLEKTRSAIALERLRFLIRVREILGIERFREIGSYSENSRKERHRKN
jgi:Spy/CpxP family protein refolding chaperone